MTKENPRKYPITKNYYEGTINTLCSELDKNINTLIFDICYSKFRLLEDSQQVSWDDFYVYSWELGEINLRKKRPYLHSIIIAVNSLCENIVTRLRIYQGKNFDSRYLRVNFDKSTFDTLEPEIAREIKDFFIMDDNFKNIRNKFVHSIQASKKKNSLLSVDIKFDPSIEDICTDKNLNLELIEITLMQLMSDIELLIINLVTISELSEIDKKFKTLFGNLKTSIIHGLEHVQDEIKNFTHSLISEK